MPYHWARLSSSPPRTRREDVREICRRHDARLSEGQLYYDEHGAAYALIDLPENEDQQQALLEELGADEWVGLVDADEQVERRRPPRSRRS
jgi:hypothetical protein